MLKSSVGAGVASHCGSGSGSATLQYMSGFYLFYKSMDYLFKERLASDEHSSKNISFKTVNI
jgi:hypothetical protein